MLIQKMTTDELLSKLNALFGTQIIDAREDINLMNSQSTLFFDKDKSQVNIQIETKYPFLKSATEQLGSTLQKGMTFAKFVNLFIECETQPKLQRSQFITKYEQHFVNEQVDNDLNMEVQSLFKHQMDEPIVTTQSDDNIFANYHRKKHQETAKMLEDEKLTIIEGIKNLNKDDIDIIVKSLI